MTKFIVFKRQHLILLAAAVLTLSLLIWFFNPSKAVTVGGAEAEANKKVFHMVTGEFSATTTDGQKIESYQWSPSSIHVNKGDEVELRIFGVNGQRHAFVIEDYNIQGEVTKGEETVVTFTADQKGTFQIICLDHHDTSRDGPMIGYLYVN